MVDNKDDIIIDADSDLDDSVVAEESAQETIKKLKSKLKESEEKSKEYLDKWQRAQADFVNLRKKDEEAKTEFLKYAGAGIISQIIPVLDSFTLAVEHGNKDAEAIYNQLIKILKDNGVEESNPIGENFDPNIYEAIGIVETKDKSEDNKILEVLQKGYVLNGKILRPAKVKIGQFDKQ
jgi:molecular chaperone GrpE